MSLRAEWVLAVSMILVLCLVTVVVFRPWGSLRDRVQQPQPPDEEEIRAITPQTTSSSSNLALDLPASWRIELSEQYNGGNLHEKINGRAGLYLSYNVQRLDYLELREDGNEGSLEIFLYEMGSPPDAFGIYTEERPSDVSEEAIGRQGYCRDGTAYFWKGRHYAYLSSLDLSSQVLREMACSVAASLQDDLDFSPAADRLPRDGLVEGSLCYIKGSPFGLDALPPVYACTYQTEEGGFQGFIGDSLVECESLLAELEALFKDLGTCQAVDLNGTPCIMANAFDLGFAFACADGRIVGAAEIEGSHDAVKPFLTEALAHAMEQE